MNTPLRFNYTKAVALADVPAVSDKELGGCARRLLDDGWRLLALFGLPYPGGEHSAGLCCVLAHDRSGTLAALRTEPLQSFTALTPACPQAHLFEREIFEQWGVNPEGHPWLKRVRRIPDEAEARARDRAEGRAPAATAQDGIRPFHFYRVSGEEVHEVAVGPVHAGVIEPGHFRFQCYGENVLHLEIALGYQHRGVEAMLVNGPRARCLPLLECAAGDTSVGHATAHCVLLERLTGLAVPRRAQLVRRIGLELERLANHTGDLGAIGGDTGFLPTSSWNGRIRGDFLNLTAALCGNRFGRGLLRPGGAGFDLAPAECADMRERLRAAGRDARGAVDVMLHAHSVLERCTGVGALDADTARALGLVGVAARACGLELDARRFAALSDLPCEAWAPRCERTGDVLARALVRSRELDDSLRMAEADLEALAILPDADTLAPDAARATAALPPGMLAVAQVEGWRGEICHVAATGPDGRFLAYKAVDPSFHNWPGLAVALRGNQISDFPLCNKSFNLSYCGHDL
ncbi:NADH-quinone oxidoreductase subunit C [uncultured Desulfovibrio sp.]|uniref:hydrogenase large subunit n=1 Tax=uncultured Desulfovibrio sp. TaxID=167968 RepID=UPI002612817D|nr:NADH-quinone oxidoreductase subunit C [uncultured Desulfovibrio sp.]